MGAWIETYTDESEGIGALVAPCVGAWIETNRYVQQASDVKSHPVWVRGLKLICRALHVFHHYVAPCVGAWIETQWENEQANTYKSHPVWVRGLKRKEYRHGRKL